jgi:hypothetical protein
LLIRALIRADSRLILLLALLDAVVDGYVVDIAIVSFV